MKKNSLEDLLAIKCLKEKREAKEILFELKDEETGEKRTIVLTPPSEKKMHDITTSVKDDTEFLEMIDEVIYESISELRSEEALELFESKDNPVGVVGKVFSLGDRANMFKAINEALENNMLERVKN